MSFFDFLFLDKNNKIKKHREFSEEISSEISDSVNDDGLVDSYSQNGVQLGNTVNTFKLEYDGILAKNGAQEVYAVVGNGGNDVNFENAECYPMRRLGNQKFELFFPVVHEDVAISLAFKDSANNWDNNSGENYIFQEGSQ